MPINVISEEAQSNLLESYNAGKEKSEIIPLVQRNANTGWPLLQVSLFSVSL